ncbi:unnamed protein product, partial [Allacma fusca]
CAQIPTVLNKETGQISLETYKVVACSENLNPYFCVEGPANPNFGQGFFTTNEQRHTMVVKSKFKFGKELFMHLVLVPSYFKDWTPVSQFTY